MDGTVKAYDFISGDEKWSVDLHEYVARPMTVKADGLYLVTITDKLFKIDTKTGKALWSYDAEKSVSSLVVSAGASPLVVGDKLYGKFRWSATMFLFKIRCFDLESDAID